MVKCCNAVGRTQYKRDEILRSSWGPMVRMYITDILDEKCTSWNMGYESLTSLTREPMTAETTKYRILW
jgi:hypothetical protein